MERIHLTLRQFETLEYVHRCGVADTGYDGSVLAALEKKGLVTRHTQNNGHGGVYYTWTIRQGFHFNANEYFIPSSDAPNTANVEA